jgi:hypothetical protein
MLNSSVWRGSSHGWFIAGLLIGGVVTASVAVLLASIVLRPWAPSWLLALLVGSSVTAALAYELGLRVPLPQNNRQVPEHIEQRGPRLGPFQFGVEMGTGLRTFMTSPVPHVALVALASWAIFPHALAVGAGFGVGRSLMSISRRVAPTPADWDGALRRLEKGVRVLMLAVATACVVTIYLHR